MAQVHSTVSWHRFMTQVHSTGSLRRLVAQFSGTQVYIWAFWRMFTCRSVARKSVWFGRFRGFHLFGRIFMAFITGTNSFDGF